MRCGTAEAGRRPLLVVESVVAALPAMGALIERQRASLRPSA